MSFVSTTDFRIGLTIQIAHDIFLIVDYQHVKPGKGGAFVRTKLKNLRNSNVIERTFKAGEKFEEAYMESQKCQYLYRTGDTFHFMDLDTFEQAELSAEVLGTQADFLKEHMEITVVRHAGHVVEVNLPITVELQVTSTEPGLKGDSSRAGTKPATLDTGAVVQVPLFITDGELIKVDTRTGTYISRA